MQGSGGRARVQRWTLVALFLGGAPVLGCSGSDEAVDTAENGELPAELMAQAWPLSYATPAAQNALIDQSKGWVTLLTDRNYRTAVEQFGTEGGLATARGHAEAAGLYRQAALIAAYSFIQTYGLTPQDTDPLGAAHLLSVSYAVTGDLEKAKAQSKLLDGATDPTTAWHAPWKQWLASGAAWPPDLKALPITLPPPAPGEWPEVEGFPHYSLPERAGATTTVDMADPGALIALALWHDQAAKLAAGDKSSLVDTYVARYRMPVEPHVQGVALPNEMLFGSDYATPEDASFVAALVGDQGASAVDAFADKSLIAALALQSRVDGKLNPEKALDLAANVRTQLIKDMQTKNNGQEDGGHRTFADIVQVGILRNLALVAEVEGNKEASGMLRINAMEKSDGPTGCPNGLLSLAAWDANNRYPSRGADILHQLIRRYPSLETARFGLDVLALRVSREGAKLPPGM